MPLDGTSIIADLTLTQIQTVPGPFCKRRPPISLNKSRFKPPSARRAGSIALPACGKTIPVRHIAVTGMDKIVEDGQKRATLFPLQQAHVVIHPPTPFLIELYFGGCLTRTGCR